MSDLVGKKKVDNKILEIVDHLIQLKHALHTYAVISEDALRPESDKESYSRRLEKFYLMTREKFDELTVVLATAVAEIDDSGAIEIKGKRADNGIELS